MVIDDYINRDRSLTMEDIRDHVEEQLPVQTKERTNGYSFYPENKRRGNLFAAVTPGPRVYVDPTAKNSVYGSTPEVIVGNPNFDETKSWDGSFNYSYKGCHRTIHEVLISQIQWQINCYTAPAN
ncbi:MAG: hypothetical protein PPP58_03715 [Natronomonas sp.]